MRNFIAGILLAFGLQQVAWTILDYDGLKQYGSEGWPYTLNPLVGGIVAVIALVAGLLVIEKKFSVSGAAAIGLAVFSGIYFWMRRQPANPYTDYGEDNFARMFINLILTASVLLVICGIEFVIGHEPTDQTKR